MDSASKGQMQNLNGTNELQDHELVRECQNGNHAAFEELVRRHHRTALKIAVSVLRDRQDAEDEVQNAFWKAFEHINQFQGDAKFSTWLTRIVVNRCLMRLRQLRRLKLSYLDEPQAGDDSLSFELCDNRQSPEEILGSAQLAGVLREEIRRTPPLLRNVFMLRDVEEQPMPQVAETLGISVAAAKSRLLRARAELRSRMQRHCGETGVATLLAS